MIGSNRGFALLVALVLSAVAAAITVSLTTLAYKSLLLSSAARESQYAFYAADTATECGLYWDNAAHDVFAYKATPTNVTVSCAGTNNIVLTASKYDPNTDQFQSAWFTVNGSDCGRITVYKGDSAESGTEIFGDGANVACSAVSTNPRAVERGLQASY